FSWPGMGRLGVEAALSRDYPLVMGVTMVVSAAVVLASLVVDLVQVAIDPRIRAS
ncbi:MAG: ABC transporter permease subunit, partial [Cytophagaceae bacterium]|nr:ABC transporter permease subunit [Gemmatimonadaceae bacterium]